MKFNSTILDLILHSPFCNKNLKMEPLEMFKRTQSYKDFVTKLDDATNEDFKAFYSRLNNYNVHILMENLKIILHLGIKLGIEVEHLIIALNKKTPTGV